MVKELEQLCHSDGKVALDRQQAWGDAPVTSFSYFDRTGTAFLERQPARNIGTVPTWANYVGKAANSFQRAQACI
jgi:hypothetical protein